MESAAIAHHRKIELQAPEDLSYLLANVRRAATSRIDEAFPPVDGAHGEDELRTHIEKLVNDYIAKTFTLAGPNLSINGMSLENPEQLQQYLSGTIAPSSSNDPAQPDEAYAPFDARLRARVEELTREEEDLLREIAGLKKSIPAAAAAGWAEAVRRGVREDEDALAERKEKMSLGDAEGNEGGLRLEALERQAEVEKGYEDAVLGLGRMKREMPSVAAKMERARGAGGYVITHR